MRSEGHMKVPPLVDPRGRSRRGSGKGSGVRRQFGGHSRGISETSRIPNLITEIPCLIEDNENSYVLIVTALLAALGLL